MSSKARNYVAGRRFEYRVRNWFRKQGWWVQRAAGSKGDVDLIAVPPEGETVYVQCKNRPPTASEIRDLIPFEKYIGSRGRVVLIYPQKKGPRSELVWIVPSQSLPAIAAAN